MSNIDYEIKRLEEFYAIYTKVIGDKNNKSNWWKKVLQDIAIPHYDKRLGELYAVRDMQTQHTYKPNEDEYYSNDESTKYITKKPFTVAAAEYAVKALPQNPQENVVH